MITVQRATKPTDVNLADINNLLPQLLRNPGNLAAAQKELDAITQDPHAVFIIAKDGEKTVGMGIAYLIQKFGGKTGFVESVVVLDSYRGQGLGKQVMGMLITASKKAGAKGLDLTSHPDRVVANAL